MGPDSKDEGQPNPAFEADAVDSKETITNGVFTVAQSPKGSISVSVASSEDEIERQNWGNPIEFLLSCIAMSVGLGNIWRFPFVALQNGGGAFLIPYLIVLLVIGRPIYYLEMCLGQFSSSGPVKVWNMAPFFKGVGYSVTFATFSTVSFYAVLIAITIFYFFSSFAKTLPWTECNEDWMSGLGNDTCNLTTQGTAELFFTRDAVPQIASLENGLGDPNWRLALALLLAWILICGILIKGVESSGKAAYFTAIFPYVVLIILLVRGVTLDGAWDGIEKFLKPDWKKLYDPNVWYEAVGQCFFSLNVAFGSIIMFSSFNPFRHNIYRDALIISFMDTFTSLLAGITIFAILGFLAKQKSLELGIPVSVESVAGNGGAALAFIAYPEALGAFGWAPQFFAVLFFLMLFTLGLGSATSLVASVVTIICDKFTQFKTWQVTIGVCIVGYLVGLIYVTPGGMHMLDLVSSFATTFVVYIAAAIEVTAIIYVYGLKNLCNDIEFMLNRKVGIYFKICWALVIPIGLPAILIYWIATYKSPIGVGLPSDDNPNGKGYTTLSQVCAWLLSAFSLSFIPGFAIHAVLKNKTPGGFKEKFFNSMKPSSSWGPLGKKTRKEWVEFKKLK